jgi:long-chain acyl-CoA synthetase
VSFRSQAKQWPQTPFESIPMLLGAVLTPETECRRALTFYRGENFVRSLTYREYLNSIEAFSRRLIALGVRRGDRVGTLMPNRLETPIVYLALMSIGAVAVPLNPRYSARETAFVLNDSQVGGVVADPNLLSDAHRDACADLRFVSYVENQIDTEPPAKSVWLRDIQPADPAITLYTSGTTAFPKGVVQTHCNLISNAWSMVEALKIRSPNQYSVMPFYHSHAVGFGMMTCLLSGGHLIVAERMDPIAWKKVVRREKVTITSMVPNLLQLLTRTQLRSGEVPDLSFVFVSAAPLPKQLAESFESTSGLSLAHAWGLSEYTNFATCLPPDLESTLRQRLMYGEPTPSVGRALEGVEVQVVRSDGIEAGPGELGELRVKGPSLMRGYQNNDSATSAAIRNGWLYSGDEGYFRTEDGARYFFVTDRIKDVISRSGEKISPTAVEAELLQVIPSLANRIAALGFPHGIYGEEIGLVVDVEDFDSIKAPLRAALRSLPVRMRPKVVLHGDAAIKRTHTGKIQRRMLLPLFKRFEHVVDPLTIAKLDHVDGT